MGYTKQRTRQVAAATAGSISMLEHPWVPLSMIQPKFPYPKWGDRGHRRASPPLHRDPLYAPSVTNKDIVIAANPPHPSSGMCPLCNLKRDTRSKTVPHFFKWESYPITKGLKDTLPMGLNSTWDSLPGLWRFHGEWSHAQLRGQPGNLFRLLYFLSLWKSPRLL